MLHHDPCSKTNLYANPSIPFVSQVLHVLNCINWKNWYNNNQFLIHNYFYWFDTCICVSGFCILKDDNKQVYLFVNYLDLFIFVFIYFLTVRSITPWYLPWPWKIKVKLMTLKGYIFVKDIWPSICGQLVWHQHCRSNTSMKQVSDKLGIIKLPNVLEDIEKLLKI